MAIRARTTGAPATRDRLSYAAARALGHVPGSAWRRYALVAVPTAAMPTMPRGYRGTELDPFALDAPGLFAREAATFRTGQGMACLGVWRGDALVGVNWVAAGAFDEDEAHLTFAPPPGSAWDTGLVVAPAARGTRAFAAIWAATRDWLAARSLRWSMSRIADYNAPSMAAHLRMDARLLGHVATLRLGARQWAWGAEPRLTRTDGPRALVRLEAPDAR